MKRSSKKEDVLKILESSREKDRGGVFHVNKFIQSSYDYTMMEAKDVKTQTEKSCCLYVNLRKISNTVSVPLLFTLKMLDW